MSSERFAMINLFITSIQSAITLIVALKVQDSSKKLIVVLITYIIWILVTQSLLNDYYKKH